MLPHTCMWGGETLSLKNIFSLLSFFSLLRCTSWAFPRNHKHPLHVFPGFLWKASRHWDPGQTLQGGRSGPREASLGFLRLWSHSLSCHSGSSSAWVLRGRSLRWILGRIFQKGSSRIHHLRGAGKEGVIARCNQEMVTFWEWSCVSATKKSTTC